MRARRSWWQKIQQHTELAIGLIVAVVVVLALIFVEVRLYGTGFAGKTLWDWLQLLASLAIPVVVGFGAVWFTTRQGKVADAENKDNQRETALQAYIDKMSELLFVNDLRKSTGDAEVQKIARVRTLTVLRGLDAERKGSVLRFLHESGLIAKDNRIIDLKDADLGGADLSKAFLKGADLSKAQLYKANFYMANLVEATLSGANLSESNLSGADLSEAHIDFADLSRADLSGATLEGARLQGATLQGAHLQGANVTQEQLKEAKSLKGATMPDGSIHP